jgi:aminoglycoside phosphotransferase (APT) family kinase protein
MEKIPAKERFSHNERSAAVAPALLRDAVVAAGMDPERAETRRLPGGFMNATFLATSGVTRRVLRLYSTDRATARREFDLLRFLADGAVATPKVHALLEVGGRPLVVMEYLEGTTLEDRLLGGEPLGLEVYRAIGRQLAAIHRVVFEQAGFIAADALPDGRYERFSVFLHDFIASTLKALEERPERLDLTTNRRLQRLVREKWPLVLRTEPRRQLVHCDFNPKNTMVAAGNDGAVSGVIDWEFCVSGNGLMDLGNFFRFAYDYPDGAEAALASGYEEAGGVLPEAWQDVARLLDIGNMCSFLERQEDYQASFRTARVVIRATLEHFGYA